jgi:hypothetical protein
MKTMKTDCLNVHFGLALFNQQPRNFLVASKTSFMERHPSFTVWGICISTMFQKNLGYLSLSMNGSTMQWRFFK